MLEKKYRMVSIPEDPQGLANAVLQLYHNPSLREELGHNGGMQKKPFVKNMCDAV